jgi:hypothetical protein
MNTINTTIPMSKPVETKKTKDLVAVADDSPQVQDTLETVQVGTSEVIPELSREERISIALNKAEMNLGNVAGKAMLTYIGAAIGAQAALVLVPSTLGIGTSVFLGGALGGEIYDHDMDKKTAGVINKAVGKVASGIKNTAVKIKDTVTGKNKDISSEEISDNDDEKFSRGLIHDENKKGKKDKTNDKTGDNNGSGLTGAVGKAVEVFRSLPEFIYPSIKGATAAEEKMIIEALDALPLKDVTTTHTISVSDSLLQRREAAGTCYSMPGKNPIELSSHIMGNESHLKKVTMHEVGHAMDFGEHNIPKSKGKPWGSGNRVTEYAKTSRYEDWAETYAYNYHNDQTKAILMEKAPEKLEALEKIQQPTLYDKVMDRTKVRELGKKVSKAIDKVPGLRFTLEMASFAIGPLSIRSGADKIKQGKKDNDIQKKFDGKMKLAQGLAFMSGTFAPIGLGLGISEWVINRRVKKGKMTPEQADKFATNAAAAAAGPAGLTYLAASKGLTKTAAGDKVRDFMYSGERKKGLTGLAGLEKYEVINSETGKVMPKEVVKLTRGDKLFMAKVGGGAVTGGAVGTAVGMTIGQIAGALIGGFVAGPPGALTGAFLGKAAGSLVGAYSGARVGVQSGRMLDKTARENDITSLKENFRKDKEKESETSSV